MILTKKSESFSTKTGDFSFSCLTVLGNREEQQDSIGWSLNEKMGLIVICDGMGGLEEGKAASEVCAETFLENFANEIITDPVNYLRNCTLTANERVRQLGNTSGSTLVSLLVLGNKMYWSSVGDSRGYIIRNGEYVQFTQDQNYKTVLDNQLSTGIISFDEYQSEYSRAESLISFIGIDELELIDFNDVPFELMNGDIILLMTDGLYRILQEETIFNTINNFADLELSVKMLITKAEREAQKSCKIMDNTTVAVLKIGD